MTDMVTRFRSVIWMAKTLTMIFAEGLQSCVLYETSHRHASGAYPCEYMHMICFSENCSSFRVLWQKENKTRRKYGGTVVTIFVRYTCKGFATFENEVWYVQTPGAFLHKGLQA